MYSSGYSQVSRYSPPSQKKMQYRSKGKSCGYYMRIVFFFSSLIQSLIIVSLVLFLVYGKTQDSASTSRIQDLEESFSRLSIENVALKQQRTNLTNLLNATLTEKARNDFDLVKLRFVSNMSILFFEEYERKLQQCKGELLVSQMGGYNKCPQIASMPGNCNCGLLAQQMQANLALAQSNFTQTVQRMRMDMDRTAKERDSLSLETIRLRREKSKFEKELEIYRQHSKDGFTHSLRSVSNVSRAFLLKIESLFPSHIAFQITCPKQREHLEQIRNNCTSLSREVEDKLQRYLDVVGDHVTGIQAENIRLKAENWRLSEDYRWCGQNRTGMIVQHKQNMDRLQQKHDNDKETLLTEKMNLIGEIKVLENNVIYKSKTVDHLTEQIKHLNMSCMAKAGPGGSGFPGLVPSRSGTQSQPAWDSIGRGGSNSLGRASTGGFGSNSGSSGSSFNKPSTTGTGTGSSFSSSGSSTSLGASVPGLNKPASSGGAFSGFGSSSSSTSHSTSVFGANKPAVVPKSSTSFGSTYGSTGSGTSLSSSNTGSNKQTSSSASSSGSSVSGTGYGSTGYGSNKQTSSSGKSSSPFGYGSSSSGSSVSSSSSGSPSSSGSSGTSVGSTNKGGSSSTNWFGFGSSNSGQSKPGSVPGRSPSSSGAGTFSGGRTNEMEGGGLTRHIQEIKLLISPPGPDSNKQDVSFMLG